MNKRQIAVIGSGIAGLSTAWLLAKRYNVTIYEANDRLGGHSNTVLFDGPDVSCPVDTGFIVYNPANYPNLVAFFDHLGVDTAPTNMSFSVSLTNGSYEYSGSGLQGLFGQPCNVFNSAHWALLRDLWRFLAEGRTFARQASSSNQSLYDWLTTREYSPAFIDMHILPMAAAIWSTPDQHVLDFPAASFFRFFANHELLKPTGRAPWRTVRNGSKEYVDLIARSIKATIRKSSPVERIDRFTSHVQVVDKNGHRESFDDVVIATHADQALSLLGDADQLETRLLGAFSYNHNRAVLHRDCAWMPKRRRLWSAWNYQASEDKSSLQVTYWMNRLQPLATGTDLFVTLNPDRAIADSRAIRSFDYEHPMFDARAMAAQRELWSLQARRRTWFCGSYFGYGFHEDALQSGLAVAEQLGEMRRPWNVREESGRIHLKPATRAVHTTRAAA